MADVAVFHASIMAGGGAEAVGTHALEALADTDHEVTLYALDDVDVEVLNERHGTSLSTELAVRRPARFRRAALDIFTAGAAAVTGITDLPLLRRAVVERGVARTLGRDHDVVVSTDGPFASPGPVVPYVHFPYYDESALRQYDTRFSERLYPTYHRVCRRLRPTAGEPDERSVTLTNSAWTADVIGQVDGRSAEVVPPPVRTDEFDPPDWSQMEDGFVCIGRVHALKRQHVAIEVVDELRANGVETHLHLVGPGGSEDYCERIDAMAADRPYVHVEGEVSRSRLVDLVEQHRFGIHARRFEHFGIAVAEMIAGDTIPFVHASGGQVAVVPDPEALTYESVEDAARKAARVVRSADRQTALRRQLDERRSRFSHERFEAAIREHVDGVLSRGD